MKQSVLFSCAAVLLGSCNNAWNIGGATEAVILPGASAVVGRHCESTAIMNALNYLGYPIEESLITGAGGALGFGFDRSTFPFIYARNGDMREQFFRAAGIPWQKSADDLIDSPDYGSIEAWHELSAAFRSLAGRIKGMKADERALEYQKLKTSAGAIYKHEQLFYAELKSYMQEN